MSGKKQQALSAARVRTVTTPGMYADGDGLNLRVDGSGAKRWVQRVTVGAKRRNIGLGGYPAVSLAEARELAADNQRAIRQGRDPLAERRRAEVERRRPAVPTFTQAAEQVIAVRRPTWSNPKHAAQWKSTLAAYAYPVIGSRPVDEISSAEVLAVLTPIWTAKPETASRVRQRMETVFDWAVAQGWRADNPAGKAVTRVLPRLPRVKDHHRALHYAQVSVALKRVRESAASLSTRLSFEFLVLTAARSGEVRFAGWSEIAWETATWTIPAARMKARREHRVPLSGRALEVLEEAKVLYGKGNVLVFPSPRQGQALSDMGHVALLRRLDIDAVPHGFRSSFRDWCIERTDAPWAVAEAALAHTVGNSTEAAYARSDLFERRRVLMEAWAGYLAGDPAQGAARGV